MTLWELTDITLLLLDDVWLTPCSEPSNNQIIVIYVTIRFSFNIQHFYLTLWAKSFSCTEIETRSWARHWIFKFKVWKALRKLKKPPPPLLSILLKQTSKNISCNHRYDILLSKLHHMKQRGNPGKTDQRQLYISTKHVDLFFKTRQGAKICYSCFAMFTFSFFLLFFFHLLTS